MLSTILIGSSARQHTADSEKTRWLAIIRSADPMNQLLGIALAVVALGTGAIGQVRHASRRPTATAGADQAKKTLDTYCVGCHNSRAKAGELAFDALPLDAVHQNADVWEKAVRKLRGRLMPPPDQPPARASARSTPSSRGWRRSSTPRRGRPGRGARSGAAPDAHGVRHLGQRSPGHRARRRADPAGGDRGQRLREHRHGAERLAGLPRSIRRRRRGSRRSWRWATPPR